MSDPVLLADGKFGMYLIDADPAGVQVHGEEEHRWIPRSDLTCTPEGAYLQKGCTGIDNQNAEPTSSSLRAQVLLMWDWERRGGFELLLP